MKLELVNILLEKKHLIRIQEYEKVADLRGTELKLLKSLETKKLELVNCQFHFEERTDNLDEFYTLLSCINEISIWNTSQPFFTETLVHFCSVLRAGYMELHELKKELVKNNQIKEACEILDQLLEIGRFLMKSVNKELE
ncbi:MAG: hypothetical protein FGM14_11225 [Flavobacteriales bacterium]|nr:hypothetical protein [Flavobacteriales bacterium]